MTKSLIPLFALSLGLVAGCSGQDDTTPDTDEATDNTDETPPTSETGTDVPPPPLLINAFIFRSVFGFDQATGTVSSVTDTTDPADPVTIRPYFEYTLFSFDPTNQTTDPDNFCTLVVYLENGTFAPWATGDIYYGVDVEPVDVEHDCDGKEFGPDLETAVEDITTNPTGVGIGVLSEAMIDIFDYEGIDYDDDNIYNENTLGGYYQIAFFDPPEFSDVYGFAYEMNANLETVTTPDADGDDLDDLVAIPAANVAPTASGIPTAAYVTETFYLYFY